MTLTDDTVLIPKQPDAGQDSQSRPERWVAMGSAPVEGVAEQRGRALHMLAWCVPAVVMGILSFIRVSWPSLWADELATWGMATASWDDLLTILSKVDATIGPYYILMFGWIKVFGASDLALRLPSMLAMTAAAGLIASLGSRLAGPAVGLLAGLFFALLPAVSRYAQEARPYALVAFMAVLATWLLVRCLDRPVAWRLVLYALSLIPLGLGHIMALLLLACHGLVVMVMRPRMVFGWVASTFPAVVFALPVLYLGRRQQTQVSWIPELTPERLLQLPQGLTGSAIAGGMILSLAVLAVSPAKPNLVWSMWAVVPAVGLAAASAVTPLWLPRYLLFTLPAWALLAAMTAGRMKTVAGILCVVVLTAVTFPDHVKIRQVDGHSQASRDVGAILNDGAQGSDAMMFAGNAGDEQRVARDAVMRYTDPTRLPKDVLLVKPARANGSFRATECLVAKECFQDPLRVWIVRVGRKTDVIAGLGEEKEKLLRDRYVVTEVRYPTGFTVALLVRGAEQPSTSPR